MTRKISNGILSGRVPKTPSTAADPGRYTWLDLNNAEPDLGVPAANVYVLTGNTDGTRFWSNVNSLVVLSANTAQTVTSNAQPNITSVGSSLTVGNFTFSSANNTISSSSTTITIDPASAGVLGTVVIAGNLYVTGNTVTGC